MFLHRRLITPLKIALLSTSALLVSACGGGGGSSSPGGGALPAGGEARYDYPSALDTGFGEAGYRVFSTGLPTRAYLGAFNPIHMTTDSFGRIVIVGNMCRDLPGSVESFGMVDFKAHADARRGEAVFKVQNRSCCASSLEEIKAALYPPCKKCIARLANSPWFELERADGS